MSTKRHASKPEERLTTENVLAKLRITHSRQIAIASAMETEAALLNAKAQNSDSQLSTFWQQRLDTLGEAIRWWTAKGYLAPNQDEIDRKAKMFLQAMRGEIALV